MDYDSWCERIIVQRIRSLSWIRRWWWIIGIATGLAIVGDTADVMEHRTMGIIMGTDHIHTIMDMVGNECSTLASRRWG